MPKITFTFTTHSPSGSSIETKEVEAEPGRSILSVALENGIHLPHACEGACACSTCHIVVNSGYSKLSPMSDQEADMLDFAWGVKQTSRLACQAKLETADIEVEIPMHTSHQN